MKELITREMADHFKYRTGYHLWCVRKWSDRIAELNHPYIDNKLLNQERDDHDKMKWHEPEYTPYVLISWDYLCKRRGITFNLPENIKSLMHEATFHHVKHHKHHPEFWDDTVTINGLNKDDRDEPSAGVMVDGTKMPDTYIASMVADWCAMSEELGGEPEDWAKKNINVRWKFAPQQEVLIYYLIYKVWGF